MKNLTMKNTLFATSMLVAGAAGVTTAYAATVDGSLGPTSTGTLDIQLEVQNEMLLSLLDTIDMGVFGGGDMSGTDDVCVYFNQAATADYQVTVDSTDTPGTFELENGGGTTIPYTLTWDDENAGAQALTAGTPLVALDDQANVTNDDCASAPVSDGSNATIASNVLAADIVAAGDNGIYQEEVSILVEPDF